MKIEKLSQLADKAIALLNNMNDACPRGKESGQNLKLVIMAAIRDGIIEKLEEIKS